MDNQENPILGPLWDMAKWSISIIFIGGISYFVCVDGFRQESAVVFASDDRSEMIVADDNQLSNNDILKISNVANFQVIVDGVEKYVAVKKRMNNKIFTLYFYTENNKNFYYFSRDNGNTFNMNVFYDYSVEKTLVDMAVKNGSFVYSDTKYYSE